MKVSSFEILKAAESQLAMIAQMDDQYPLKADWIQERVGFMRGWEAAIKWVKENSE